MPICPILKWYMPEPGSRDKPFPINSVVEGSITLRETEKDTYRVRIVTYELEKRQQYFECAVDDYAKDVLEKEGKYQPRGKARHYGLIIVRPGLKLADSIVMDFISYHRHPTAFATEPTASRYGISAYNEVFETRALKERALKKLRELDGKKAMQSKRKALKKVLKEAIPPIEARALK